MVEKDIGQEIIDKLENLNVSIESRITKLKKNSHLHMNIDTKSMNEIKEKAKEQDISMAEWCRRKLRGDSQLDRIEGKLDKFIKG